MPIFTCLNPNDTQMESFDQREVEAIYSMLLEAGERREYYKVEKELLNKIEAHLFAR